MYEGTSIFFESPKRLLATLEVMQVNLNNQTKICVAKELTKIHESYIRGTFSEVLSFFSKNQDKIKGEFILLIDVVLDSIDTNTADEIFEILKNDLSIKMISKLASGITGLSKNDLYKRYLSLSEKN
jgi:16S rRNA (cytidine1402-2'-O)-methyltransferase